MNQWENEETEKDQKASPPCCRTDCRTPVLQSSSPLVLHLVSGLAGGTQSFSPPVLQSILFQDWLEEDPRTLARLAARLDRDTIAEPHEEVSGAGGGAG